MDKWLKACETNRAGSYRRTKAAGIVAMVLATAVMTLLVPSTPTEYGHLLLVTFRQLFLLCVILAAIWFGWRGVMITAGAITLVYLPNLLKHLFGKFTMPEMIDQLSTLLMLWLVALIAGALIGQLRSMLTKLAETREDTLMAIVCALDRRELDSNLEAHSVRVRNFAVHIARRMKLPEKRVEILSQAALLHDIGKIGVPDSILIKAAALNTDEWEHMATHSDRGFRILAEIPAMEEIAPIVRAHHEQWDGRGYPRGLAGNDIPLEARIFAVADAFDAMVTDRPYRKAVGCEEARRRIIDGAGAQFDPEVVEVFKRIPITVWSKLAVFPMNKPPREVAV